MPGNTKSYDSRIIIIQKMIPLAEYFQRAFGSVSSENFCGKGDSIMYCGKYHSDSVYLVIYQADFQSAEKDKDFQRIDHKIGRPCDEKK